MNSEQISKSDVLDILFENKNKAYGAYNLRKFYNQRMNKALATMLGMVVVFSVVASIPDKKTKTMEEDIITVTANIKETPEKKKEEQPKEKVKPKTQEAATQKVTNRIVFTKKPDDADTIKDIDPDVAIGSRDFTPKNPGTGNIPVGVQPGGGGGDTVAVVPVKPEPVFDPGIPIDNADVQPEYPGGMNALRKFLERHLTNPQDLEGDEQVSVKVKFVVGYDGKLKSFETVQDGGEAFNKEVIRVLKKMPEWIPGRANGRNVSVFYTIPVKFVPGN